MALKLYQLDEGRKALALWRDSGAAGNQDPGRFAELLENETEATAACGSATALRRSASNARSGCPWTIDCWRNITAP